MLPSSRRHVGENPSGAAHRPDGQHGSWHGRADEKGGTTMTEAARGAQPWLARWASEPYVYLTTIGRRTGRPHRIEIWFAAQDGRLYLMSGGRERADWVRNLQATPQVTVELGDETHAGAARIV